MKFIAAICIAVFGLSACGDDPYEYQNEPPADETKENLRLVRECIATGGTPEYATGSGGVVTVFYGCRP